LFVASTTLGALLAASAVETVRAWWSGAPVAIEAIAVLGNHRLSGAEIASATGLAKGDPLRGLAEEEIQRRVAQHPWLRRVRVALLPTGTLVIEVEERREQAILRTDAQTSGALGAREPSEALYLVDSDCVPFLHVDPTHAGELGPLLRLAGSREAIQAEGALCTALALGEAIGTHAIASRPDDFELVLPEPGAREGWVLRAPGGHEVLLGNGNLDEQQLRLADVGRLFAANLVQLEQAQTIDLRFADQAILRSIGASK
jgi:hypothetical protein